MFIVRLVRVSVLARRRLGGVGGLWKPKLVKIVKNSEEIVRNSKK